MAWGYVVSVTRGGRHKSLHHVGSCWRVPGQHFKEYEVWGDVLPPAGYLQSRCKDCFKLEGDQEEQPAELEDGTSSSSSSSGSRPAKKKAEAGRGRRGVEQA